MKLIEHKFQYKNFPIYGWHVQPADVRGIVVLVHGLGEHSGRYLTDVVPRLIERNLVVFSYDNFGHGKSGGKRGHCPDYDALLQLLDNVIAKARMHFPNNPVFLYGHSMGGNLVLNYALRFKSHLAGVIATSPYLKLAFQPPQWKMLIGRALLRFWPNFTMSSGLDPEGLSRIAAEVNKYKQDPLVHDRVSPMFIFPIQEAGDWAIDNAHKLRTHVLLLHGTGDKIIDYRGTEHFYKNSKRAELRLLEGGYHELHKDVGCNDSLDMIVVWINMQMDSVAI